MFLIDDEFKPKVKEDIYENQVKHEESLNTDDDDDNKLVIKDDPYSQDESDAPNNMSQVNLFINIPLNYYYCKNSLSF